MGFHSDIGKADKLIILFRTGIKAIRGICYKCFLKKAADFFS